MPQSNFSLLFDGSSGYVNVPDAAAIRFASPGNISVAAWLKYTSTSSAYNEIVGKEAVGFGYVLLLRFDGRLAFYLSGSSNGDIDGTGAVIPMGVWTHVGATFDGTTFKTYINGALDSSGSGVGTSYQDGPGSPLSIGGNSPFAGGRWLGANLDDVLVSRSVLTAGQFAGLADGSLDPTTLTLAGLWRFEEGTGLTTADSSGNADTGALNGGVTWSTDVPTPLGPPIPQSYAPATFGGPPMRGAPWLHLLPVTPPPIIVAPVPPPVPGVPSYAPDITGGPPMRGAPWLMRGPLSSQTFPGTANVVPPPPPPPPPGIRSNVQLVPRVPDINTTVGKDRMRRHTEIVASILNSLILKGILVQDATGEWKIVP